MRLTCGLWQNLFAKVEVGITLANENCQTWQIDQLNRLSIGKVMGSDNKLSSPMMNDVLMNTHFLASSSFGSQYIHSSFPVG